ITYLSTTVCDKLIEIMEEILSYLDIQQLYEVAWKVSYTWSLAVHNLIISGFRKYGPIISKKLDTVRQELLEPRQQSAAALDHEMVLVAEYSFLQILYSEYRLIYTTYWNHSALNHLELIFEAGVCLREFQRLLNGFSIGIWDWKVENISLALDNIRSLNTRFLHYFFWQVWNPSEEKLGPMVLEILDCSLNSTYFVTTSHDKDRKYENTQCHICGNYGVLDLSNTLKSLLPDLCKHQPVLSARMLICYMSDAIRWSNLFHMLRLRWVCMDRALSIGRRREILVENVSPYVHELNYNQKETTEETDGGSKVIKIIQRNQNDFVDFTISRLGIRCDFQLWCTLLQAPISLVGRQFRLHCDNLPLYEESTTCTKPYHFKMEFKACVRAIRSRFVECTVWVEETAYNISIDQNKETISLPSDTSPPLLNEFNNPTTS
ncbi:uncharacterized protein LOC142330720, partial [Lycorma delicatula]|uniref:uncharacterized protein LOC142330720 n=1 Tax=Lycorma delicatula TaxID=130591 RepID=UPI003F513D4A